jgi:hypothetical protein
VGRASACRFWCEPGPTPDRLKPVLLTHFRNEHAVETRARELNADDQFLLVFSRLDVDDAALRGKLRVATRRVGRRRNLNFQLEAEVHRIARGKGGSAAAKIFAGSALLEGRPMEILTANHEREDGRERGVRAGVQ